MLFSGSFGIQTNNYGNKLHYKPTGPVNDQDRDPVLTPVPLFFAGADGRDAGVRGARVRDAQDHAVRVLGLLPAGADGAPEQQAPHRLPQGHPAEAPRAAPPVHVQRGDQRPAGSSSVLRC